MIRPVSIFIASCVAAFAGWYVLLTHQGIPDGKTLAASIALLVAGYGLAKVENYVPQGYRP